MAKAGEMVFSGEEIGPSAVPRPLRVLVVDDDRDTVAALTLLLEDEGYNVHSVHSGRYVMAAILDIEPDVVILDIHLPELSGWEVAKRIRGRCGRARPMLIGISGEYRMGSARLLSGLIGFDHYLLKPYDPKALLALLAPLLASPRQFAVNPSPHQAP